MTSQLLDALHFAKTMARWQRHALRRSVAYRLSFIRRITGEPVTEITAQVAKKLNRQWFKSQERQRMFAASEKWHNR